MIVLAWIGAVYAGCAVAWLLLLAVGWLIDMDWQRGCRVRGHSIGEGEVSVCRHCRRVITPPSRLDLAA